MWFCAHICRFMRGVQKKRQLWNSTVACMHGTVMKFTSCQFRFRNNGQNPTRIDGEMGSQCFELCTITCLLWQSDDVRMHKTTQISELRFVHRKLTRIGGYLGTRQTPMKSQGILLEGAVLIERFLRNPYPNAPQDCGCPDDGECVAIIFVGP